MSIFPGFYSRILKKLTSRRCCAGSTYSGAWDGWYGPSGRETSNYDLGQISQSIAGRTLARLAKSTTPAEMMAIRQEADVQCDTRDEDLMLLTESIVCKPLVAPCLFNVKADPCERHNLADK